MPPGACGGDAGEERERDGGESGCVRGECDDEAEPEALPALLTAAVPQIIARRLRDERPQRTIFTATRSTTADAPAVLAVRQALHDTARQVAAEQRDLEVVRC